MAKAPLGNTGWQHVREVAPVQFKCGFCDNIVSSNHGWHTNHGDPSRFFIRVCPHCHRPTYTEDHAQHPGVAFGETVAHLPDEVATIYDEARRCCSDDAFTGAVLLLRKLLMNVAVQKGADPNRSFVEYVNYLSDKGYVPPDGKPWVDHIRQKGNEATH